MTDRWYDNLECYSWHGYKLKVRKILASDDMHLLDPAEMQGLRNLICAMDDMIAYAADMDADLDSVDRKVMYRNALFALGYRVGQKDMKESNEL